MAYDLRDRPGRSGVIVPFATKISSLGNLFLVIFRLHMLSVPAVY